MSKLKTVVTVAVWVLFIDGLIDIITSLVTGFGRILPVPTVEIIDGVGVAAVFLACVGVWLRKKLE